MSREHAQVEYRARINRVCDYIREHLDRKLPLEELARIANFSPYHFHRIFRALVGETTGQFVRRARLEAAASRLCFQPGVSITEVALDCGFSSVEAFGRAFRSHFGMTASAYRESRGRKESLGLSNLGQVVRKPGHTVDFTSSYGSSGTLNWRMTVTHENRSLTTQVEIREMPEMPVAYVRHTGPYAGDSALFGDLFGRIMRWAGARGLLAQPDLKMLSIYHNDPNTTEEDKLEVSVGITVPKDTTAEGEVGILTLAAGSYAVARFEVDVDQYPAAWEAVYGEWLPQSGYQPRDGLPFEWMLNNPQEHPEGKHQFAICVPVQPLR